jgi:hypothetical protein
MANDFPRRRIAQEFCDIDQECVEQLIYFVGMGADVFRVGGVVAHIKLEHTPAEPALQGGLFVATKIEFTAFREFLQKVV